MDIRKKMDIPARTEQQKKVKRAYGKCGNLHLKNPNISWILDDEAYFTLSRKIFHIPCDSAH